LDWGVELTSTLSTCRHFGIVLPASVHLLEPHFSEIVAVPGSRIDHIAGSSKGGAHSGWEWQKPGLKGKSLPLEQPR
jgi:hypothetical protein